MNAHSHPADLPADVRLAIAGADRAWRRLVASPVTVARRAAGAALATVPAQVVPLGSLEIGLVLASDEMVRTLNRDHRGQDKPTNVLAFPVEGGLDAPVAGARLLGDVVLARETVALEAREQKKPPTDHFSHLVVHGILHLLGFDHETTTEAETMEAAERAALARLGIRNPYADPPADLLVRPR